MPRKKIILPIVFMCWFSYATHSDSFSLTNRYESTKFPINSITTGLMNSQIKTFGDDHYLLSIQFDDEQLSLDASTTLACETAQKKAATFGVVTGKIKFTSSYIDARVRLNWYTMKKVDHATPEDIQYERFNSGKLAPVTGMPSVDFTLPESYLKFKYKALSLIIGKVKLRWGPGYKGTLALSGTAQAPFYFYHLTMNLASRINLSCFMAGYDDDRFYRKEFTRFDTLHSITRKTSIITFPSRYGVGQRIDLKINDYIMFGIHELCNFYGSNDVTRYMNPLQVYYLGYNSGTNEANMMGGCDINVIVKPFHLYGEFLDDDITIFDNKGNPNKYAYQLGIRYYPDSKISVIGAEYTHVSRYTYGHYSILNRHEYWGEPMAWPWGNDQDVFTIHLLSDISENVQLKFETNYWLVGAGTLKNEWLVDGRPNLDHAPYWPHDAKRIVSILTGCAYTPFTWLSSSCTYRLSVQKEEITHDLFFYLNLAIPAHFSQKW